MGNLFASPSEWQATSRNVLITGASAGIGAELARNFAKEGARLALLARNRERLEQVAEQCRQLGAEAVKIYTVDLTVNKDIDQACRQAVADFDKLDVVILNAGRSQGCYFQEIKDVDQIDYMMKLNVSGVMIPLQKLLPHIYKSRHSRIVIVSSTAGVVPVPYRSIYCASKFAVSGFANTVRMELQDTYRAEAPKVCLVTIPEVSGTSLNTGRMTFGAEKPPIEFRADASLDLKPTCQRLMAAIRAGVREWGKPLKVQILQPLYSIVPGVLERLIMKHLRKTHVRPSLPREGAAGKSESQQK